MDTGVVFFILSRLAAAAGLALAFPFLLALYRGDPAGGFAFTAAVSLLAGGLLRAKSHFPKYVITPKEGTAIVALGWIMTSFLYAIPYAASGILSPLDALVESISGLTGTGATVITDLEIIPKSYLFFRAMTHWLGGLGIIVIFVALIPQKSRGTASMVNAESTGPTTSRALPRIKEMSKALFLVYLVFTLSCSASYVLLGMDPFDAVCHAFATIATGGFSTWNNSTAHYSSPALQLTIVFFMTVASANFGVYVAAWQKGIRVFLKDTEFRVYLCVVGAAALLMGAHLAWQGVLPLPSALQQALFHASSVSSTTGFVSYDFETWPSFDKMIILMLMMMGGCAGSTTGGIKVTRIILLFKSTRALLLQRLHPHAYIHVRSNGSNYPSDILVSVYGFFLVYITAGFFWAALLMADGLAMVDAVGVSFSTMSNVGPAFGLFGATDTYAPLPFMSKIIVCCSMLFGRLECFTLMAIFIPNFWKKGGW